MILILTASIMCWSMQQSSEDSDQTSEISTEDSASVKAPSSDGEDASSVAADSLSNLTVVDAASETYRVENGNSSIGGEAYASPMKD
ncbi:hypothetical protein AXF42_Ash021559 [Apostasia shenzhenica]|uniref:Uncharacterized protein n=1 Tax=Apostasia shenzhenica TaxID=1088818 RepID=A0A2H9ZZM9_9ASPA|nr:hypothetical protein AXF42_Ash021559 [Apostasia shenzhenica]